MRALVGLGALLALVACDAERPEPAPQPAAPLQQAAEPERREPEAPAVPPAAPPETAAEPVPAPAAPRHPPAPAPQPMAPARPAAAPPPAAPREPAAPVAPPSAQVAAERPLDLSLPSDLGEDLLPPDAALLDEGLGEEPPERLLPPLFKAEENRQSSFELGGRLITNEGPEDEEEGYWDTVEGAELQLHFRR